MITLYIIPIGEAVELPYAEGWAQWQLAVNLQAAAS